ncbi:SDR family NAD(P)-dependent oxidoreductase [Mangrovicoccus ximenensis]|uniref:SDR family NAD(P)-dependent oxidoreductase n=1 Tax=Mangrovicoccus ximenensis TaxID=1911570 RepID=UPI001F475D9E|nr:SDR family oxidoreductase [Mangrovicoccus ximenensis]
MPAATGPAPGFLDLDRDAGEAMAAETGAAFEPCDLRDIEALKSAVARLAERCGPATVLVNNAARDDRHDWREVTPDYWDERMATNLRHQFFAIQAVAPGMIAAGGGSIVNMGSGSWLQGTPQLPVYGTAKAGVHGLTRMMARELGPHRIRVNAVIPGWVMTERQQELWVTPEKLDGLRARQCLPDLLAPGDLADAVLFLASDAAKMITAAELIVDAGAL